LLLTFLSISGDISNLAFYIKVPQFLSKFEKDRSNIMEVLKFPMDCSDYAKAVEEETINCKNM